jgi:hypothetical protein
MSGVGGEGDRQRNVFRSSTSNKRSSAITLRLTGWRGEKTNRMWVVEKPAGEEPSGQRFLTWVVRHLSWRCSRGRHPVEETGVYWPGSMRLLWRLLGCGEPEHCGQAGGLYPLLAEVGNAMFYSRNTTNTCFKRACT